MKYISELRIILSHQLDWHKSRIDCFAQMLLALFLVRSVNLSEIAVAMEGDKASIDSRYKRVYRFFSKFEFDFTWIARWVYSLFFNENHKVYIALDRTNWFWGKAKINVCMLSICYEGIATNQHPKNAIACYLRRWEIETLFAALKTKGWRFEDTRVIEPKRIEKLLALLVLGLVWVHRIGEWQASIKPIPLKKLRNPKTTKK